MITQGLEKEKFFEVETATGIYLISGPDYEAVKEKLKRYTQAEIINARGLE